MSLKSSQGIQPATRAGLYFAITFAWSILFWSLTIITGGIEQTPGSILQYVGGAGPLIAALLVTHLFESSAVQRDFWSRTFDPRRIPVRWLVPTLFVHPLIILSALLVDGLFGGELQFQTAGLTSLSSVLSLVFFVFVFGPLPEEMGWRGVAYDRMQMNLNPLTASLLLGLAWAAWHIPLFFIEGTFQNQLDPGSLRFWVFLASNVPLMVIMTWIYNHTDRSVLCAALVHFSGNIVGAVVTKTDQAAFLELVGLSLFVVWLVIRTGTDLGMANQSKS